MGERHTKTLLPHPSCKDSFFAAGILSPNLWEPLLLHSHSDLPEQFMLLLNCCQYKCNDQHEYISSLLPMLLRCSLQLGDRKETNWSLLSILWLTLYQCVREAKGGAELRAAMLSPQLMPAVLRWLQPLPPADPDCEDDWEQQSRCHTRKWIILVLQEVLAWPECQVAKERLSPFAQQLVEGGKMPVLLKGPLPTQSTQTKASSRGGQAEPTGGNVSDSLLLLPLCPISCAPAFFLLVTAQTFDSGDINDLDTPGAAEEILYKHIHGRSAVPSLTQLLRRQSHPCTPSFSPAALSVFVPHQWGEEEARYICSSCFEDSDIENMEGWEDDEEEEQED
jgi:hypothetical protein